MRTINDFDRRIDDWLEEGAQTIPDWLLDTALQQAHATSQLGAGLRLPWIGGRRPLSLGRLASVAAGALGALAVVAAFVLGIVFAPQLGDDRSTPSPSSSPTSSLGPPASVVPRPIKGLQASDVLPGDTGDFYALVGLTSTRDAVWTVAVTGDPNSGDVVSRLVRVESASGEATPITIPGASGTLSPPAADGEVVWTASAGGLHRIDGTSPFMVETFALAFQPGEIAVDAEGVWIARDGGTTLVNRVTGEVIREVAAQVDAARGRIIGAPLFGSLWACGSGIAHRLDPTTGSPTASLELPADGRDCHGPFVAVSGVDGLADGVVAYLASAVIDPEKGVIGHEFDVGAWSDLVVVEGRLWFLEILRDRPGTLALIELDPATRRPEQILTFAGSYHLNTSFESGYLAVAGDFLWLLVDPSAAEASDVPQIVRVPLSELR